MGSVRRRPIAVIGSPKIIESYQSPKGEAEGGGDGGRKEKALPDILATSLEESKIFSKFYKSVAL